MLHASLANTRNFLGKINNVLSAAIEIFSVDAVLSFESLSIFLVGPKMVLM
jgi:hypothetical protein